MRKMGFVAVLLLASIPARASMRHTYNSVESEVRSLANALESYAIDNGTYPHFFPQPGSGLDRLTTPVAYISSIPYDSFAGLRSVSPLPLPYKQAFFFWFFILGIIAFWIYGAWNYWRENKIGTYLLLWFVVLIPFILLVLANDWTLRLFRSQFPWNLGTVEFYHNTVAIEFDRSQPPGYYFYSRTADGAAVVASQGPDPDYNFTPEEVSEWTFDELKDRWPAFASTNGLFSKGDYLAILPPHSSQ